MEACRSVGVGLILALCLADGDSSRCARPSCSYWKNSLAFFYDGTTNRCSIGFHCTDNAFLSEEECVGTCVKGQNYLCSEGHLQTLPCEESWKTHKIYTYDKTAKQCRGRYDCITRGFRKEEDCVTTCVESEGSCSARQGSCNWFHTMFSYFYNGARDRCKRKPRCGGQGFLTQAACETKCLRQGPPPRACSDKPGGSNKGYYWRHFYNEGTDTCTLGFGIREGETFSEDDCEKKCMKKNGQRCYDRPTYPVQHNCYTWRYYYQRYPGDTCERVKACPRKGFFSKEACLLKC